MKFPLLTLNPLGSKLIIRNRQPDQRAKKWAEINLGSNRVFGSSQWIAVSYCELLCGEILWMRSCHLTSAMFSTIWWYVLWQVLGRVALHGMMLSSCSSEGVLPMKGEQASDRRDNQTHSVRFAWLFRSRSWRERSHPPTYPSQKRENSYGRSQKA